MKPPSALDYLIGNNVVAIGLAALTLFAAIRYLAIGDTGWLFLGGMACLVFAGPAHGRVSKYGHWKRQWDAMNDTPPRPGSGARFIGGLLAWGVMAFWARSAADDPGATVPITLFWIATALMGGVLAMRLIRPLFRPRPSKAISVQVCVAKPISAPTLQGAYDALPDYCRAILG